MEKVGNGLFRDPELVRNTYKVMSRYKTTVERWVKDGNSCMFTESMLRVCNNITNAEGSTESFDINPYECVNNPFTIGVNEVDEEDLPKRKKNKEGKKARKPHEKKRKPCNYDIIKENVLRNCDIFAHVGGPVWGLALCPFSRYDPNTAATTHFLAVGTSTIGWYGEGARAAACAPYIQGMGVGYDFPFEIGKISQYANIIQIYRVEVAYGMQEGLEGRSESFSMHMSLCYCVGLEECGPVWDLQWCKSDGWDDDIAGDEEDVEEDLVLGLLGVVCGDGTCRVVMMPSLHSLGISYGTVTPTNSGQSSAAAPPRIRNCIINNTPLISMRYLQRWEFHVPGDVVTSSTWGAQSKPFILACGMASGRISLWDLTQVSAECAYNDKGNAEVGRHLSEEVVCVDISSTSRSAPVELSPYESSSPHWQLLDLSRFQGGESADSCAVQTAVRSLMFCPFSPEVLCSAGHDGVIKVWTLEDSYCPSYAREVHAWIYTVHWESALGILLWSTALAATVQMDAMWKTTQRRQCTLYSHLSNHGAVWGITSTEFGVGNSMVMSVCSDGSVFTTCSKDACIKQQQKNALVHLFRVLSVENCQSISPQVMISADDLSATPVHTSKESCTTQPVTTVHVDCTLGAMAADAPPRIHPPPVALHRITHCKGTMLTRKSYYGGRCKLVAYGGACGLVRVHMVHQDLFGTSTMTDLFT